MAGIKTKNSCKAGTLGVPRPSEMTGLWWAAAAAAASVWAEPAGAMPATGPAFAAPACLVQRSCGGALGVREAQPCRRPAGGRGTRSVVMAGKGPLSSENLSIGVGGAALTLLLVNRMATEELANAQSRSDLLGVAICSALLVSAFSTIDVKVREKEVVELAGVGFDEVLIPLDAGQEQTVRWAAGAISRVCANAKSVAVYSKGTTVARLGIMGRQQTVQVGPIAESALKSGRQQYLADLQILPGRFEFGYLPVNTQAILLQVWPDQPGAGKRQHCVKEEALLTCDDSRWARSRSW